MSAKKCFKCGELKPLSEFYKHPSPRDRHLGKCIECVKLYVTARYQAKKAEINAYRERYRRLNPEKERVWNRKKNRTEYLKFPEKVRARNAVTTAKRTGKLKPKPCMVCGFEPAQAHHEDYSKRLDVKWLCLKHHKQLHRERAH